MQRVIIIPESEWQGIVLKQEQLEKEVQYLKKGLTPWVDTAEAERMLGVSRSYLDARRNEDWEYGKQYKKEGRKVLYNRSELEAHNDSHKIRRRRAA